MLGDIRQVQKVYIVCGYTDMRKGLNGLVPFVQQNFGIDPYSSSLFLFCGKRCDRLKALLWDCAAVQAAGQWPLPVATECPGGQAVDLGTVHLAHAGAEH